MTDGASAQHFDQKKAQAYDNVIRQVVPAYDTLHDMIALMLSHYFKPSERHFLSVGCGTGLELIKASHQFQNWKFIGIEPSVAMAKVAHENLQHENLLDRCQIIQGYVNDLASEETFDIASVILVMHFLADDGAKKNLLRDIFKRLKPGARLFLADLNGDAQTSTFQTYLALWREWQLFKGMPEHIVERGFRDVVKDIHFISEVRILELLSEAGFSNIEPFYKAFLFGGWIAQKE